MANKLQFRRGTAAEWTAANPILANGEPGYETDTVKIKIGDGATAWNSLPYFSSGTPLTTEQVQDIVAAVLVAGSGMNITYDDVANTITFVNSSPLSTEAVQDIVGAMATSGTNATATYDDTAGTLTISATGDGTGLTQEQIEDIVATLLVQGTNVTLSYNDATGQLTITAAGGGSTDTFGALSYTSTTNLDLSDQNTKTLTLTGDVTFTTSNRAASKKLGIRIIGDTVSRAMTFPAGWKWQGTPVPGTIAANAVGKLTLECYGTAETDILAGFSSTV